MLQQEQCALSNDRYDLADQIALLNVTEAELNRIKAQTKALKQKRVNKLRMVEITNYETNRYEAHRNIFKNVAFCALGVVFSLYLVNKGWTMLGKSGVVLSIGIGTILTVKSIFDAWWRSPMNWNRYQQSGDLDIGKKAGDTVWAHDVNAFWKGVGEVKRGAADVIGDAGKIGSVLGSEVSDAAARLKRESKSAAGEGNDGCPHNWYLDKGSGKCVQICPSNKQSRNAAGRCQCGLGGDNHSCVQGAVCSNHVCV